MPNTEMRSKARHLRQHQTPAERLLWSKLRSRQISGFKFRRQHPFGNFILDFYCPAAHLAIEVDGGQHSEDKNQKKDAVRTEYLASNDVRVIRFWNHEVLNHVDTVIAEIYATIEEIMKEKQ